MILLTRPAFTWLATSDMSVSCAFSDWEEKLKKRATTAIRISRYTKPFLNHLEFTLHPSLTLLTGRRLLYNTPQFYYYTTHGLQNPICARGELEVVSDKPVSMKIERGSPELGIGSRRMAAARPYSPRRWSCPRHFAGPPDW